MKAIQRVIEYARSADEQRDFASALQPGSEVMVVRVSIDMFHNIQVREVNEAGIACTDRKLYSSEGRYDPAASHCRFLVEPTEYSREVASQLRCIEELRKFPWKELTYEQVDAVLKYALSKHANSPRKKQ